MRVEKVLQSLSPQAVPEIQGFIGQRLQANREHWLARFDIDRFVHMIEEKQQTDWFWIGEQTGKWLEAAILASQQAGDLALRRQAEGILRRLIAAQEPGGYLGITSPGIRTAAQPVRGMDAYEQYFTHHALLTAYEEWGDQAALQCARRLGDYWAGHFGPGKAEFWPDDPTKDPNVIDHTGHSAMAGHSVHGSLEGTLLMDPMMRLYGLTGEPRYLDWCRWVIGSIDRWSSHDTFTRLDRVADGTAGIHEVLPYVHAHTFHMNFLAFLRLYQATGDPALLRKVQGAWQDIANRQMYVTGGVSVGEHYEAGYNLPNSGPVVETCASMSWMELCQSLLELTADPRYADAIERLLWNHLFAAQTCDGDGFRYHTPLNGSKPAIGSPTGYFTGPNCCSSSGPRIIAKVPGLLYACGRDAIYINQFAPSEALVQLAAGLQVNVRQLTDFAGERVVIEISPGDPATFALHVRLPAWCDRPSLAINDQAVADLRPGTYATLQREWRAGDRAELVLPMVARWLKGEHGNAGLWCLTRGPLVYALDTVWFGDEVCAPSDGASAGMSAARLGRVHIDPADLTAGLTPAPSPPDALGPAIGVPLRTVAGVECVAPALPFANVGHWYRSEQERGNPAAVDYAYAVWVAAE